MGSSTRNTRAARNTWALGFRGHPMVTLGMPVRNEEPLLTSAIQAIVDQTFSDWELVISDNASTDRTSQIALEYHHRNPRKIKYTRFRKNQGMIANFNRVLDLAHGDFFAWVSGHDYHDPRWLESLLHAMRQNPDAVLAYSSVVPIASDGTLLAIQDDIGYEYDTGHEDWTGKSGLQMCRDLVHGLHKPGSMVYGLYRTKALRRAGGFPNYLYPDALMLRRLAFEGRFVKVAEPLYYRCYLQMPNTTAEWLLERPRKSAWAKNPPWHSHLPMTAWAMWYALNLPLPYGPIMAVMHAWQHRRRAWQEVQWNWTKLRRGARKAPARALRIVHRQKQPPGPGPQFGSPYDGVTAYRGQT